jgi:beta-glucosidase
MANEILKFPQGFLWGSGTSAHQVEGGCHNDWTEWEVANADRLAGRAKNYWQEWQWKKFPEMLKPENYISGIACDHYNRYEEDFDLAKSLGQNAHRLSIEWSRIEQEEGKFDEQEIEHYRKVISSLRERGIEPFVTIWHWPLPPWLARNGGLKNKKLSVYFSRYSEKLAGALGGVKFWITLNEPEIYSFNCFLRGVWPPQKKNPFAYLLVINNLIKAHREIYKTIKKINPNAQIGIAAHNVYFEAYKNHAVNIVLKKIIDWWWNYSFLNRIKDSQDFIGLNFYFHHRLNYGFRKNENKIVSDLGWELYPHGIYEVLIGLKKYSKPIYITENGLADREDKYRAWFIKETLRSLHQAIAAGADVRGYLHWSLIDFIEWDKGFWPRFGLVAVDRNTLARTPRPSAKVYAEICKNNQLMIE